VLKSIERYPRGVQRRLLERLDTLRQNPRALGTVKLTGFEAYRVRVGDYRIIYTIHDDRLVVLVVEVGHRRDIYRRR